MINLFDGSNSNDFHSQLSLTIDILNGDVKDLDIIIDKITNFLENNRKELINDANTLVVRALVDRISVVFSTDANNKVLGLIKNLRDSVEFNESLNRWLTENDLDDDDSWLIACKRIKKAWVNQAERLELNDLGLTELPSCIGQLTQLKELDLKKNPLISLPNSIEQLTQLKELDLQYTRLTTFPNSIEQLTQLQYLNLQGNKLTSFPNSIEKLTQLEVLNLRDNQLISLPDTIGLLTRLKELNLRDNKLTNIPTSIEKLTQLEVLDLRDNQLISLPDTIGLLTRLKELNLRDNKLTNIPTSIGKMTQLEVLDLSNKVSRNGRVIPLDFEGVTLLGNNLKSLPNEIGQLTQLKELNLAYNALTSLPDTINLLTQLKKLDLGHNRLTNIPPLILELTQLKKLNLQYNKLTSIPTSIGQLIQLQNLDVSSNELTSLPVTIGNCINIVAIMLFGNRELVELPISLGQISGITSLHVTGTSISQEHANDILRACQALREEQGDLIPHLHLWMKKGKKQIDLQKLLDQLTKEQQTILNEWLIRLEKTKDFKHCQQQLAAIVCDMLSTLLANSEFKESFFIQAEANNEACQDRAAMSLNVIYTYWKICSLPEKLEIIVRAAKTSAFRKALSQMINEYQKKEGNAIEHEAVEIYLYYETYLREKLNLLSAIQQMTYTEIGKRDWIDENILKDSVEISYREELADYPAFKTLVEQDDSFNIAWESLSTQYSEKINALYDQKGLPEGELLKQSDALRCEREEKWKEMALEWFEKQLSLQSRKRSSSSSTNDQQDKRRKI